MTEAAETFRSFGHLISNIERTMRAFSPSRAGSVAASASAPVRPVPAHALNQQERERILQVANEPRFAALPPARIVPMLADEESLFRTAKYRPEFPVKVFADLQQARQWASAFVSWFNHDHRHSRIRYVSPAQRHAGEERDILAARDGLYVQAKAAHPRR